MHLIYKARISMKRSGFTLIEILVAMAIFTLIGLASTGLLTTVIDSNSLSQERFEKLQLLQRAMVTIERDIQQAVSRPVRANGEKQEVVMAGGEVDGSDDEIDKFVNPNMNTLFVPPVDEQMMRKRVKSFKKKPHGCPSEEAKMEDDKDPYLMDSDDDEDDDEMNVSSSTLISSNSSSKGTRKIKKGITWTNSLIIQR